MQNRKRRLIFALSVVLTATMFPPAAFGGETVKYQAYKLDVGLMNIQSGEHNLFRQTYLRKNDRNFNLAYKFKLGEKNNVRGATEWLSYKTGLKHHENGSYWNANYVWNFTGGAADKQLSDLIESGQIAVDYSANMTADKHSNFKYHWKSKLDRAYSNLLGLTEKGGKDYFIGLESASDAPDEAAVYHSRRKKIGGELTGFLIHSYQSTCKCGSSRVSEMAVGLVDDTSPRVTSINASAVPGGTPEPYGFKAGEKGYLNLIFSEPIRFAKDVVPTSEVILNLVLKGTESDTQVNVGGVTAKLTELSGNRLSFAFTVPESIQSKATNVYISDVARDQSSWISTALDAYDLVLLGESGAKLSLSGSLASDRDLTKTSSLVTDIAGNPVNWSGSTKTMSNPCYLDNVIPSVSRVDISGARISKESNQASQAEDWPEDIDRSAVFAGTGDKLTFSVLLTEEIKLPKGKDASNITATLNARDGNVPVILAGASLATVRNGVNGIKVSRLNFEPLTITKPLTADDNTKPLSIAEISFPSGTSDLRDNVVPKLRSADGKIPAPAQQQYLDTDAPKVTTKAQKKEGSGSAEPIYVPIAYMGSSSKKEFYFPILVEDSFGSDSTSESYLSGVNGLMGSFGWQNHSAEESFSFEYYVSASAEHPEESQYLTGGTSSTAAGSAVSLMPFRQVETGNYIHIRLKDDVQYNIADSEFVVKSLDYATNTGSDSFKLDFVADLTPPVIVSNGVKQSFNSAEKIGALEVTVTVTDAGGMEPDAIQYQWVERDASPEDSNWKDYNSGIGDGTTRNSLEVILQKENLLAGSVHQYDLYVRAKDQYGNQSDPFKIACEFDLAKANPNLKFKNGMSGKPVQEIEIGMDLNAYTGTDSTMTDMEATTVVMIKNPEAQSSNEYFVIAISSRGQELAETEDLFDALKLGESNSYVTENMDPRINAYSTWYLARVTEEDDGYRFSDSRTVEGDERLILNSILKPGAGVLAARSLGYYGDVEMTFITAYGEIPQFYSIQEYTDQQTPGAYVFSGRLGEKSAFYLDDVDGVYLDTHGTGVVEKNSFYYSGTYDASGRMEELLQQVPALPAEEPIVSEEGQDSKEGQEDTEEIKNPKEGTVPDGGANEGSRDEAGEEDINDGSSKNAEEPESEQSEGEKPEAGGTVVSSDPVMMGAEEEENKIEDLSEEDADDMETPSGDVVENSGSLGEEETLKAAGSEGVNSSWERVEVVLPFSRIQGNLNVQSVTIPMSYFESSMQVEFERAESADGQENLLWKESYEPGVTAKYLKNLDGAKISFTLSSKEMEEWGVGEIDFESEDTYVALYYTEHGISKSGSFVSINGQPPKFSGGGSYNFIEDLPEEYTLIKNKLIESKEQIFVIPAGLTDKAGFYALEVSLKPFNSSNTKKFYYTDLFADGMGIDDNGIADYSYDVTLDAENELSAISLPRYMVMFETSPSSLLVGTAPVQDGAAVERSISIWAGPEEQREKLYYDDGNGWKGMNGVDKFAIRVWNAASTANGSAPEGAQWHESSYASSQVNLEIVGAESLAAGGGYENESGLISVPILSSGVNTLCYQIWLPNGNMTPAKQFTINASDQAPQFDLHLDSRKEDGWVPSITAYAENVSAVNGAVSFECHGAPEKEEGNLEPITITESWVWGEPGSPIDTSLPLVFYILDRAGNITVKEQVIDWVDSTAPQLAAVEASVSTENEFHVTVTVADDHSLTGQKVFLTFDKEYSNLLNDRTVSAAGAEGRSGDDSAGIAEADGAEKESALVTVEVPINESGSGQWLAAAQDAGHGGIYKTVTTSAEDGKTKNVEVWGVFRYDKSAEAEGTTQRRLTFTASDAAGNLSAVNEIEEEFNPDTGEVTGEVTRLLEGTYLDIRAQNIRPAYKEASMQSDDRVRLTFTAPVLLTNPEGSGQRFDRENDGAAIYSDGEYALEYTDLFGETYKEAVKISVFEGWNANVKFSETEPTRNDVTVSVEIPKDSKLKVGSLTGTLGEGIEGDSSAAITGTIEKDGSVATLVMTNNGTVVLELENENGVKKTKTFAVSNIDRKIDSVTPYYYYMAGTPGATETSTAGTVVVGLYCDEMLKGLNGPLTYTFTNGAKAGDQYTFKFEDMAQNQGELTVTLAHDINIVELEEDTTPPEYNLALYVERDYLNQQMDSVMGDALTEGTLLTEALNALGRAQGYLLSFNIFDESKVKVIIKRNGSADTLSFNDTSDSIEGVEVTDRMIAIKENATFTVYLVDESGNTTKLPEMRFTGVDRTPPSASVKYEGDGLYKAIGYLVPAVSEGEPDGQGTPETIIITNLAGVTQAADGEGHKTEHIGRYYHEYLDNENFTFYFKDDVGNAAQVDANVDWLDVSVPVVIGVKWNPAGVGQKDISGTEVQGSGEQEENEADIVSVIYQPPTSLTNKEVTAQVQFNKTISSVKAYDKNTHLELDSAIVSVSYVQSGAVVTYHQNADVELHFTSKNGKKGSLLLGSVSCIDKDTFTVSESKSMSEDKQSVTYTFRTSKGAYLAEDSEVSTAGSEGRELKTEFQYTFTANGDYSLHFTDGAGNSVVHAVTVDQLDHEIMTLLFNTAASDTGAVSDASKLSLKDGDTFYIKLSKDGTLTFNEDVSQVASAGVWVPVRFTQVADKIFYGIEARDDVRKASIFSYIKIELPDKTPPAILFSGPTVSVKQGSEAAEIQLRLNAGITASDDRDGSLTAEILSVVPVISETEGAPNAVPITNQMEAGKYTVTYKAADSSGNETLATRTLRIYSADSLNLLINGNAAEPESTMVLRNSDVTLTIENLPGNGMLTEPCRVSYKAGLKTAGQMKIGAVNVSEDRFTLPKEGFYTLYIQAQDRKEYLTYVYIQE